MLVRHHASPAALKRTEEHKEAMKLLGFDTEQARLRRFPTNPSTQKGNLAEIVLAEYIVAASGVVAFDLDMKPVRIIVGEAKFRAAASTAAVEEIVEGLCRSHRGGIPMSLQFVADRLFDSGQVELGRRVLDCAKLFAQGELRIDYVGLLLSDAQAGARVDDATPASLHRLAMISLGVSQPDSLVSACYQELE
jgi:hypothetical protein